MEFWDIGIIWYDSLIFDFLYEILKERKRKILHYKSNILYSRPSDIGVTQRYAQRNSKNRELCKTDTRERKRKKRRKAIKHAKIKKKTRRFDSWKHKKSSISRHKKIVMYNVPKTISLTILLKEDYSRFTSRGRPTFCHTCARKW